MKLVPTEVVNRINLEPMNQRIDGATELVEPPSSGRLFSSSRKVRLGDVTPKGRLRLDSLSRYLQDVANDDSRDADIPDAMWWILRRTRIVVSEPCAFDETVELTTWCSGTGSRWAERRTTAVGSNGGRIDAVAIWVAINSETGAPRRVDDGFDALYGEAAGGRRVRARSLHGDPDGEEVSTPWPIRYTDLDLIGHVNNAIYWCAVEESMASHRTGGRVVAEIEFRAGVDAHTQPVLLERATPDRQNLGWFVVDGAVVASYLWSATDGNSSER